MTYEWTKWTWIQLVDWAATKLQNDVVVKKLADAEYGPRPSLSAALRELVNQERCSAVRSAACEAIHRLLPQNEATFLDPGPNWRRFEKGVAVQLQVIGPPKRSLATLGDVLATKMGKP